MNRKNVAQLCFQERKEHTVCPSNNRFGVSFLPRYLKKKRKKCLRNLDLSFKAHENEINYAQGLDSGCGL